MSEQHLVLLKRGLRVLASILIGLPVVLVAIRFEDGPNFGSNSFSIYVLGLADFVVHFDKFYD